MSEIHEPTIERVRRDVDKYKCQAAWLDTWSLLRMFDELREENEAARRMLADERAANESYRADLSRALPVVEAVGALVEHYMSADWDRGDPNDAHNHDNLVEKLVYAVRGGEQE